MLRALALAGISGYQRHLSPRKGWRCAYGAHTGRTSCSDFGRRAVDERGVVGGIRLLVRRFDACRAAALALATEARGEGEEAPKNRASAVVGPGCGGVADTGNVACCAAEAASYACW